MSSEIRVVYTLTWDPPEIAGWAHKLENGTTLYFHEAGISAIKEIIYGLDLKETISFGTYFEAFELLKNGSADIGSMMFSHDQRYLELGLGKTWIFLQPVLADPSYVFFRQPLTENHKITMLRPFTGTAWLVYLLVIAILSIITSASFLHLHKCHLQIFTPDLFIRSVQIIIGRPHEFGTDEIIWRWRKIMNVVICFLSVIMLSLYTAQIVSVLTLKNELVKTPDDLLKYDYKLHTYSLYHIDRLFQNPAIKQKILKKIQRINYQSTTAIVSNVIGKSKSDPRQAIFAHRDGFYPHALKFLKYNSTEMCPVSYFISAVKTPRSLYIQKDSPFREKINLKILHLQERGFVFRRLKINQEKFEYNCPIQDGDVNPLSLQHSLFAFFLLSAGFAISLLIEIFWKFGTIIYPPNYY